MQISKMQSLVHSLSTPIHCASYFHLLPQLPMLDPFLVLFGVQEAWLLQTAFAISHPLWLPDYFDREEGKKSYLVEVLVKATFLCGQSSRWLTPYSRPRFSLNPRNIFFPTSFWLRLCNAFQLLLVPECLTFPEGFFSPVLSSVYRTSLLSLQSNLVWEPWFLARRLTDMLLSLGISPLSASHYSNHARWRQGRNCLTFPGSSVSTVKPCTGIW